MGTVKNISINVFILFMLTCSVGFAANLDEAENKQSPWKGFAQLLKKDQFQQLEESVSSNLKLATASNLNSQFRQADPGSDINLFMGICLFLGLCLLIHRCYMYVKENDL